ncbi:MAG: ferrous iron transport protein B [Desulfobulbus sp.]|jgi:ferrous iron transport protein B
MTSPQSPKDALLVGLAGQQNAGKSTVFNMLTGANQHIANYPGVTVDKKSGSYRYRDVRVEVVDLPGTYSLTSFSLEERVARDFLLHEKPDVLINVVDASSLKRSLYFTFQVLELGLPVVLGLNMMDIAQAGGIEINIARLGQDLGIEVVPLVGRKRLGRQELQDAVLAAAGQSREGALAISYEELEAPIRALQEKIRETGQFATLPGRWLAVKLVEGDSEAERIVTRHMGPDSHLLQEAHAIRGAFESEHDVNVADYMVGCRDRLATQIVEASVKETRKDRLSFSDRVDMVVLNRFAAPFFLLATVFLIYQLSIVKGYELTQYWWPVLAKCRSIVADILPAAGMLEDSPLRSMGLWMVDSANALLNYIPIFLILFSLIAILEDSGYMARIAFLLDKILHLFGLHGQSTLPYILGGVFAGGCAVPGVMATKGIPDHRSRMATILTVPYMNCLAKIPFYTLLVNVFFAAHKAWAMLFLSTITIFIALLVARLLTVTVLKSTETAPFVMELPRYHLPTFFGVAQRALERTWQYIKKVGTIVVAVSVFVFTLLQFPGIDREKMAGYQAEMDRAVAAFHKKTEKSAYSVQCADEQAVLALLNVYDTYKTARLNARNAGAARAIDDTYRERHPEFFVLLKPGTDKDARVVNSALRTLAAKRDTLRRHIKEASIETSFLGMVGRTLEPVTQWAGFNWKINIAIISSFAARESSVATIGALYQQGADQNKSLEERIGSEAGTSNFTPLHALAIIVFFAMYPPCLATTIMIKVQTGSYKWMLFSFLFPTTLGFLVAVFIFTGGSILGLSGIQMMGVFYALVVLLTVGTGLVQSQKNRKVYEYVPEPSGDSVPARS